jgi:2-polyprenyl-3-methyl-5-hydroxy-6-metoxy-1,4-benzoquinol methylase
VALSFPESDTQRQMEHISIEDEIASVDWYHVLDLGGVRTPGIFDMSRFVHHYDFPESLEGKSALDVGMASGFFAFHLESLGANPVIGTDLERWEDHDFSIRYNAPHDERERHQTMLTNAFEIAKRNKASIVKRILAGIYSLPAALETSFDLVVCANVLLHLQNPYLALANIRQVTRGIAVISTEVYEPRFRKKAPIMVYLGKPHLWWAPTPKCMELMSYQAGFSRCKYLGSHLQRPEDGSWENRTGVWHLFP